MNIEDLLKSHFFQGFLLATLGIVVGILLLIHLIWSYCYAQICKKAGTQPGVLVWLPILQFISLLRAARMSGWWFLALFVPLLNVVIGIVWCFKIATARGKSALVGLLLLLPITNLFAFLYLVFSDGAPDQAPRREKRANGTISLQTT